MTSCTGHLSLLADTKTSKVFVESEGFMNALSTQAAKMKEKKVKKVSKVPKLARTNSSSEEVKQDVATPPVQTGEPSTESMEGECEGDT